MKFDVSNITYEALGCYLYFSTLCFNSMDAELPKFHSYRSSRDLKLGVGRML
jgi:hypothetical protein